jgi:hypothetical protein
MRSSMSARVPEAGRCGPDRNRCEASRFRRRLQGLPVGRSCRNYSGCHETLRLQRRICWVCWFNYGPREMADKTRPAIPPGAGEDPTAPYVESPPDAVPDISATSEINVINANLHGSLSRAATPWLSRYGHTTASRKRVLRRKAVDSFAARSEKNGPPPTFLSEEPCSSTLRSSACGTR